MAAMLLGVDVEAVIFQGTTRWLRERQGGEFGFMKVFRLPSHWKLALGNSSNLSKVATTRKWKVEEHFEVITQTRKSWLGHLTNQ